MTATSSARCGCPARKPAARPARDAWAAADDLVLRKIAQAGLSGLSGMINGTPAETAAGASARRQARPRGRERDSPATSGSAGVAALGYTDH